ncbi:TPA: hypothetical protein PKR15_002361 [Acinetobacter baumannii]|uniref:hypothetical protein n=2 Tax=Acinetobacter baumannii TaxID=470 RepID=UPI00178BBD99|nr:hypothetical protein [Acinetobacter baumannii]MCJ8817096.1 hypothetical protein [Acinetobacter baumannii]MCJ8987807.1 hypothetical protein [Acinetobacter baumannii]QOJ61904.1 hypothetical protein H0529_09865 [Acinetobacter baumannii]HAV5625159.1 hypothetical protein [Acinetobacter baumannii]HDI1570761.1 hypothetical protein [Acinetobacter baumannii]
MGDVHTDRPKHADNQPVSYDSGVNLISNEDIFRLLKKRHDHRWASYKGCGNEIYEGIFYETICLLENLERQLGLVYNRAYPTRDDFLIALEHGDQQRLNQIIKFYEELRVERDLIKYAQQTHFFSKNVQAYIAYLKRYPDSHFWKKGDEWQVKTFPHEALFDFFEIYLGRLHVGQTEPTTSTMGLVIENPSESDEISQQQKLAESENIEKTDRVAVAPLTETLTQDVYKQFDEGLRQFNEFLARHKSLRVMCFEITLTPQEATFGEKWRALDRKRNELSGCFNLLIERYGLLAKYSRIEMGINSSLVLQWVLLFKGHDPLDTGRVRASIQQELELQMAGHSYWNTQPFKVGVQDLGCLFHSLDSGYKDVIKARSKSERKAFEYWVLGYLYCVDYFLKPNLLCIADSPYVDRHYEYSVFFREGPSVNNQSVNHRRHQTKTDIEGIYDFIDLDFSAESKQIWKNNNLPKHAKDDLKLLALLYSQYKKKMPIEWREKENFVQLLVSIEHFMRLIQHNPVQVLIDTYLSQTHIEKFPLKSLSQQAKQYLHIGQQLTQFDLSLKEQIADLAFVGWRVRLFLQLFIENLWGFQINRDGIADLKSCLDRFKDLENYRIDGLKERSSFYEIEKEEAVSVKRNQAKAKDYLNKAIIQDVFAFRLVFSYQPNKSFTSEDNITAFNTLLTDFLKNLKRTRKISGESLVAYIGTRIFIDKVLNADITLIFSAQTLSDYDEQKNKECIKQTRAKVIEYWRKYLSIKDFKIDERKKASTVKELKIDERKKASTVKELKIDERKQASTVQQLYLKVFKDENLRVSQRDMITSLPRSADLIHIKHHDSKTLRSFKSELADFYSGHGLLCKWKSDILENLTSSDEGHSSRSMDQFLKGHVTSTKSKPLKPKQATTLAQSKIEEATSIDEEQVDNKEQVVSMEELRSKFTQQVLDTLENTKYDI